MSTSSPTQFRIVPPALHVLARAQRRSARGLVKAAVVSCASACLCASLAAAQAPILPGAQFEGGTYPSAARVLDMNADGKSDLLVTSTGVRVLLGNGQGRFEPFVGNVNGPILADSDVADVDGDGDLDVCAGRAFTNTLFTYLGDGAGNFAAPLSHTLPASLGAIALGHFDAGPRLDAVVSTSTASQLHVLHGNGQGQFTPGIMVPLSTRAEQVFAQDFDGDGDLDVILVQGNLASLGILLNDGMGAFSTGPSFPLLGQPYRAVRIDLDGDLIQDLILSTNAGGTYRFEIMRADGAGQLIALPAIPTTTIFESLAAGDLDGDGLLDFAAKSSFFVELHRNLGGGVFAWSSTLKGVNTSTVTLADVDGDAGADLVFTRQGTTATVGVFIGDHQGGLLSAGLLPHAHIARDMVIQDMDLDGANDLVLASSHPGAGLVSLYRGDGHGGFTDPTLTNLSGAPSLDLAVGRVDLDAYPDALLASAGSGYPTYFLPGSATGFGPAVALALTGAKATIAAGDANGDSLVDLFRGDANSAGVDLHLADGLGGFGAAIPLSIPHGSYELELADVGGDGALDLASFSRLSGEVSLLKGDGLGGFALLWTANLAGAPSTLTFIDADGDHDLDIVVISSFNVVDVFTLDQQGALLSVGHLPFPVVAAAATAFDVNADGWSDLVASNGISLPILFGSPSGLTAPQSFIVYTGNIALALPIYLNESARPWICAVGIGSTADMWIVPNFSPPSAIGETYCSAKLNSLGCLPAISASGISSASATSGFLVQGANVRNQKPGLLFYGSNGRRAVPFQGGTHCIALPTKRTPVTTSGGSPLPAADCTGVWTVDLNAFAAGALGGTPPVWLSVPGEIVNCQYWGRDPGFAAPHDTSLTNAFEYSVGQ